MKIHYLDIDHDMLIPIEHRIPGHNNTLCGYQRENATLDKGKVTCKLCLRELNKEVNHENSNSKIQK